MSTSVRSSTTLTHTFVRSKPVPYIIWWAIGVHAIWGVALIFDPGVAPAAILVGLHWVLTMDIDRRLLGVALVVAAILAATSLVLEQRVGRLTSLGLLLPQYALLIAALISDTDSVITGDVAGRAVDRLLLFTALWPIMLAAVLHSISILERHWTWARH